MPRPVRADGLEGGAQASTGHSSRPMQKGQALAPRRIAENVRSPTRRIAPVGQARNTRNSVDGANSRMEGLNRASGLTWRDMPR